MVAISYFITALIHLDLSFKDSVATIFICVFLTELNETGIVEVFFCVIDLTEADGAISHLLDRDVTANLTLQTIVFQSTVRVEEL